MAEESKDAFLHRWSRRKHEAEKEKEQLPAAAEKPPAQLPPVDKLTPESDFTGFMQPKVQDALRRAALKKLFLDPHFKTPDPFEPFSGDWTVGEPISEKMLASLEQMKHMLRKPPEAAPSTQTEKTEIAQEEKPQPDEPARKDA